jgi:hypothetical protein
VSLQALQQFFGSRKFARKRVAHSHRQLSWRFVALLDDIEVMIESRDFINFGERELHLFCQRNDVLRRDVAVVVLNLMQMLDQQIVAARLIAEQRSNFLAGTRIGNAPFALAAGFFQKTGIEFDWRWFGHQGKVNCTTEGYTIQGKG